MYSVRPLLIFMVMMTECRVSTAATAASVMVYITVWSAAASAGLITLTPVIEYRPHLLL